MPLVPEEQGVDGPHRKPYPIKREAVGVGAEGFVGPPEAHVPGEEPQKPKQGEHEAHGGVDPLIDRNQKLLRVMGCDVESRMGHPVMHGMPPPGEIETSMALTSSAVVHAEMRSSSLCRCPAMLPEHSA